MNDLDIALSALLALLENAAPILSVLRTANSEGRTTLTAPEWSQVRAAADAAHAHLEAALTGPGSAAPSSSLVIPATPEKP